MRAWWPCIVKKESLLHPELYDPSDFSTHSLARPVEAEVESVSDQLRISQEEGFKGHLHICHLSSIEALHEIEKKAKAQGGVRVSCAVTPHHALLSSEEAKDHSLYAKMNRLFAVKQNVVFSLLHYWGGKGRLDRE